MRTKVLTLRFSSSLGRFDDAPLIALQQKVLLDNLREHVVTVGDEPMLLCLVTWREQQQPSTPPRAAADGTSPETAPPREPDLPSPSREGCPARPVGELRTEFTAEQRALFDRLRAWRRRTANDEGAPPYVILTNRQLVTLVRERPDSKAGLARIDGLGERKVARHGDAILQELWRTEAPATDVAAVAAGAS